MRALLKTGMMKKKGTTAFSFLLCQGQSKRGSKEKGMETGKKTFFVSWRKQTCSTKSYESYEMSAAPWCFRILIEEEARHWKEQNENPQEVFLESRIWRPQKLPGKMVSVPHAISHCCRRVTMVDFPFSLFLNHNFNVVILLLCHLSVYWVSYLTGCNVQMRLASCILRREFIVFSIWELVCINIWSAK